MKKVRFFFAVTVCLCVGLCGHVQAEEVQKEEIERSKSEQQEILSTTSLEAAFYSVAEELNQSNAASDDLVIVLDPGHDSTHGGTSRNNLREDILNLKIARYCLQKLEEYDVTVYMTREDESCPYPGTSSGDDNTNRVHTAASLGADVYISMHLNSSPSSSASGVSVYYPNQNYNPGAGTLGEKLAQVIQDMLTNLGLRDLGIKIRNSEDHTTYPDGSLADYYNVIRTSKECGFPGIIIEHAFMSNTTDVNRYLSSEEGLKRLGEADADAIIQFFGLRERSSRGVFDAKYYYDSYPDLREAIGWNESALWRHVKTTGVYEGRIASPVFDITYYKERYSDLQNVFGNDIWKYVEHFSQNGMKEGRQGAAEFDVQSYRLQYADLRQAYGRKWELYYEHYIDCGKKEGRQGTGCTVLQNPLLIYKGQDYSAVYDFRYYTNVYPDIMQNFGDDDIGALEHFVTCGMKEGRRGNEAFDIDSYRRQYVDLRNAFGKDLASYYLHYLTCGKQEGRQGNNCSTLQGAVTVYDGVNYAGVFDFSYYKSTYKDIAEKYENDDIGALEHFITNGMKTGRQGSAEFDVNSYRNQYVDLRVVFGNDLPAYYLHYLNCGKQEGRQGTGCFELQNAITNLGTQDYSLVYNYDYYVSHNADVKGTFGNDDIAVLQHFIDCGMNEGRQASEYFNVQTYRERYADLNAAFGDDWKSYFVHYLKCGKNEGRSGTV